MKKVLKIDVFSYYSAIFFPHMTPWGWQNIKIHEYLMLTMNHDGNNYGNGNANVVDSDKGEDFKKYFSHEQALHH